MPLGALGGPPPFPLARPGGDARSPQPLPVGTSSSSSLGAATDAALTDVAHAAMIAAAASLRIVNRCMKLLPRNGATFLRLSLERERLAERRGRYDEVYSAIMQTSWM